MRRSHHTPLTAYLLVNAATLLWGGNIVLGRALRHLIGPWSLAGLRAGVASLLFTAMLLHGGSSEARPRRREGIILVIMALTGVVGFQVLLYTGLQHTTAVNAGLVNATGPLATILLSNVLLRERLGEVSLVGSVLSLLGVGWILTGGSWQALRGFRFNPGDLFILAAVVLWGLYSVAGKVILAHRSTAWVTALSTMIAVPILAFPATMEFSRFPPTMQPALILGVLYIGVGPSFLAFLAWNEGVKRLGPTGAMAFYNTLPLYAGILSAIALGELPGTAQVSGGLLVVAGCLLAARGRPVPAGR